MRIFGGIASETRYRPLPPKINILAKFARMGVSKVDMALCATPATHEDIYIIKENAKQALRLPRHRR